MYHLSKRLSCSKHLFLSIALLQHLACSLRYLNLSHLCAVRPCIIYQAGWKSCKQVGFIPSTASQYYCPSILRLPIHGNNPWYPRELSSGLSWPDMVPFSTPQPLASLSLSPALESCNWVELSKRGKSEDGWDCWKTVYILPRGHHGQLYVEEKKQRCHEWWKKYDHGEKMKTGIIKTWSTQIAAILGFKNPSPLKLSWGNSLIIKVVVYLAWKLQYAHLDSAGNQHLLPCCQNLAKTTD